MDISEVKEKNKYYERIIKEVKKDVQISEAKTPKPLDASGILFRSSGVGFLMIEPKKKTEKLSESTKTNLVDIFISYKYKRKEEINNKFLDKGNECEDDSITLYSRVSKRLFKKNTTRLENSFVTGEWDLSIEENGKVIETIDTKTSWSAHTFFRSQHDEIKKMYYWQGQSYMWLTGAKTHTIVYCLVNGLADIILQEKRLLSFKKGMMDINGNPTEKYLEKAKQIEINNIFDLQLFIKHNPFFEFDNDKTQWCYDIPMEDRIFEFKFDRNNEDIERLKNKIIECRKWMNINLFKVCEIS